MYIGLPVESFYEVDIHGPAGGVSHMIIGDDGKHRVRHIKKGILEACKSGVRLLFFPECAVTGYPPHCIEHSSDVDFEKVTNGYDK